MALPRHVRLVILGIATAALAAAVWAALDSASGLNKARQQTVQTRAELDQLRNLLPAIEQREAYSREAELIRTRIEKGGLDPNRWTHRRVQRTAAVVSRQDAEKSLGQVVGVNARQWFAPESFAVSVINPEAGLFTPALADDRGFSLEMTGMVYFPISAP